MLHSASLLYPVIVLVQFLMTYGRLPIQPDGVQFPAPFQTCIVAEAKLLHPSTDASFVEWSKVAVASCLHCLIYSSWTPVSAWRQLHHSLDIH